MQVFHFSDPHVGAWFKSFGACFDKRLLGALNYNIFRKRLYPLSRLEAAIDLTVVRQPQVLALTGDLTTIGEPQEFEKALRFFQSIIDSGVKILYIPGNHDAYVRDKASRIALEKAVDVLNEGRVALDSLPSVVKLGKVEFIMLNEAKPTLPYKSNGYLAKEDVEFLQSLPERGEGEVTPRILVGHYPCRDHEMKPLSWRRSLIGADVIKELLESGQVDVSLCGHTHVPYINHHGNAIEICAGSVTKYGHVNVLDINEVSGRIEQRWETLDQDNRLKNTGMVNVFPHLRYSGESLCCFHKSRKLPQ